jgi:transposase
VILYELHLLYKIEEQKITKKEIQLKVNKFLLINKKNDLRTNNTKSS